MRWYELDDRGNVALHDTFGGAEGAKAALVSLEDCSFCVDCMNCACCVN